MKIKLLKTERIEKIFQSFLKQNPNPTTELNYSNHFELLIAVMLSAHTTDVSVNKATPLLFQKAFNRLAGNSLFSMVNETLTSEVAIRSITIWYFRKILKSLPIKP